MAAGTETSVVAGITFMTIVNAQFFGVPVADICVGAGFACMGVVGRAGWELQRVAQGQTGMTSANVMRWVSAGFIGAPFVSTIVIILFKLLGAAVNDYSLLGFLLLGFIGPQAVSALVNTLTGFLKKRTGVDIGGPKE